MVTLLNKKYIIAIIPLACLLFCSCQKTLRFPPDPAPNHDLQIQFKPIVDADTLVYGNIYHNTYNEPYTVRNFKFYVSQIELTNTDSNIKYKVNKDQYFLVDFAHLTTATLSLNAVAYTYNRISFTIGVDSIHNVSGAQTERLTRQTECSGHGILDTLWQSWKETLLYQMSRTRFLNITLEVLQEQKM